MALLSTSPPSVFVNPTVARVRARAETSLSTNDARKGGIRLNRVRNAALAAAPATAARAAAAAPASAVSAASFATTASSRALSAAVCAVPALVSAVSAAVLATPAAVSLASAAAADAAALVASVGAAVIAAIFDAAVVMSAMFAATVPMSSSPSRSVATVLIAAVSPETVASASESPTTAATCAGSSTAVSDRSVTTIADPSGGAAVKVTVLPAPPPSDQAAVFCCTMPSIVTIRASAPTGTADRTKAVSAASPAKVDTVGNCCAPSDGRAVLPVVSTANRLMSAAPS